MSQRNTLKKEISKDARQLFKQGGKTKQEVYEFLVGKYKYAKDVADVLKYIPSTQAMAKYGKWNTILLSLLILTAIIFFLVSPSIATLLWYGFLIYGVATMRIKYYVWVTVLSSCSLLAFIVLTIFYPSEMQYWTRTIFALFLVVSCCFLPVWLEKKLCPKPNERKEKYKNTEGEERMRIVYEFRE